MTSRSVKPTDKLLKKLYGAVISQKSADEIMKEIKDSRNFNREPKGL